MSLKNIVLLFTVCSMTAASNEVFNKWMHDYMSTIELTTVFHVESKKDVPEFEVLSLNHHYRAKRDTDPDRDVEVVKFSGMGKDLLLNLKRNPAMSRDIPLYLSGDSNSSLTVVPVSANISVGVPYQDVQTNTSLVLTRDSYTGSALFDGIIGDEIVLASVPREILTTIRDLALKDLNNEKSRARRSLDNRSRYSRYRQRQQENIDQLEMIMESSEAIHVVYKPHLPADGDGRAYVLDRQLIGYHSGKAQSRRPKNVPSTLYLSILVFMDHDTYMSHGGTAEKVKAYMKIFWNAVDIHFKSLHGPKLKIMMAGIVAEKIRGSMPYIKRNMLSSNTVDIDGAHKDLAKYLFFDRELPDYDAAVYITKHRLRYIKNGKLRNTNGIAIMGGACVVDRRQQKVNAVAIVEDKGTLSGVKIAAHEIGHLLGAVHDGDGAVHNLENSGALDCPPRGFLMGPILFPDHNTWSKCSIRQMKTFLRGEIPYCMYNSYEQYDSPIIFPGKSFSVDEQCKALYSYPPCYRDHSVCSKLSCGKLGDFCYSGAGALEGTRCGNGNICYQGNCVAERAITIRQHQRASHGGIKIINI